LVKPLSCWLLTLLLLRAAPLPASQPDESHKPGPTPTLMLARGICVDRQVRTIPPEVGMRVDRDDVRLIDNEASARGNLAASAAEEERLPGALARPPLI